MEFFGLPFEAPRVPFYGTARSFGTTSTEQVCQPLFWDGLKPWGNFGPWLDPKPRLAMRYLSQI